MISRRRLLITAAATFTAPCAADAQPADKPATIGVLLNSSATSNVDDLRHGLRDLGYVEGQTFVLDVVSADGELERLTPLAAALVRRKVDVIVTSGPSAVGAARAATNTVPIIMGRMDDVDSHGFVKNLARPGGNITGLSFQTSELAGKWVHLLKETVPRLSRLAILWDARSTVSQRQSAQQAARVLGLQAQTLEVRDAARLESAFRAAVAWSANAVAMLASPGFTGRQMEAADLGIRNRLPMIYYNRGFADAGGLLSYGPSASEFSWRRAAVFVDKILKGAKPGELPVEQPTKFELIINARTARLLGLAIPPSVLLRADHVIE